MLLANLDPLGSLLSASLLGIGGCALGLGSLFVMPASLNRSERYATLLSLCLAGVAGAAGLLEKPWALWLPALLLASVWLGVQLCRLPWIAFCGSQLLLVFRAGRIPLTLLLAALPLLLLGLFQAPDEGDFPIHHSATTPPSHQQPGSSTAIGHVMTDWGSPVPMLYMPPQEVTQQMAGMERQFIEKLAEVRALLNTGPADPSCNCHGWVFTGGRYWIEGPEAQRILEENDYQEVREPQVDDLAVYRDETGQIAHTALVRTVTSDGLILVESKWGQLGRYVHRPTDLRFGRPFTYYRSSRKGHLLRGLDVPGTTAALSVALSSANS